MSKAFALFTTGLEVYAFYLVVGKLITSITIKFYVLLYYIYRIRHRITKELWSKTSVYVNSFLKIIICLCPKKNGQQLNHKFGA